MQATSRVLVTCALALALGVALPHAAGFAANSGGGSSSSGGGSSGSSSSSSSSQLLDQRVRDVYAGERQVDAGLSRRHDGPRQIIALKPS
jgi:hypothetical protein